MSELYKNYVIYKGDRNAGILPKVVDVFFCVQTSDDMIDYNSKHYYGWILMRRVFADVMNLPLEYFSISNPRKLASDLKYYTAYGP